MFKFEKNDIREFLKSYSEMKKVKLEGGAAFHEKSEKNKKVNLGGPGKRNPRKTKPTNRGVERTRAAKRKKK